MENQSGEPLAEYTRFRANIQLGDGPDQRGDLTVETVRERDPEDSRRRTTVTLPGDAVDDEVAVEVDGVQGVPTNDREFAEFYYELTRGRRALREVLGLDTEEDDG